MGVGSVTEAIITGLFALGVALLGWFLRRLDRNNTKQHADNTGLLHEIHADVKVVQQRLNHHIEWHLEDK